MSRLCFEPLESRRLLAGAQNSLIRFDVDDSGDVKPLDALVVLNDLAINRVRELAAPPLDASSGSPLYPDVNGDGWVTPVDALQVLNALHKNAHPLNLALWPSPADDPNGNGVVFDPQVMLLGQTSHDSQLTVRAAALDSKLQEIPDHSVSIETTSDASGMFSLEQSLFAGVNRLEITVTDEIGRRIVTTRELVVGDVVSDWNAAVLNVVRDWTTTSDDPYEGRIVPSRPPEAARALAMIHVAMFDAINAIEAGYTPYLAVDSEALPPGAGSASSIAAAASAAHDVATALYPEAQEQAVWTATLAESLATVADGEARQLGIDIGQQVAAAMLLSREEDGSNGTSNYQPGTEPGQWNRTLPDFLPPLLPHWGQVRPMAVDDITAFRPQPPPSLESPEYAEAVDEVMRLGRLESTERTEDQTQIALFWADGGGTATPPGHWNRIATRISLASGESLLERARTLALLNLAMADAGIASWDAKYAYDFWRPLDAIRRAEDDGNEDTVADSTWLSLIRTPPFPAYTSGHSSFSGAAAQVLTELYGGEFAFASRSDGHTGLTQKPLASTELRQFAGFWEAAEEAGMSRIYGGIHFAFDSTTGLAAGRAIGSEVIENWLRPSSDS